MVCSVLKMVNIGLFRTCRPQFRVFGAGSNFGLVSPSTPIWRWLCAVLFDLLCALSSGFSGSRPSLRFSWLTTQF